MNPLRIGFLLPDLRHSRSYMPLVMQALIDAGVVVDVIHPTDRLIDLSMVRVEHDLYVLRQMSGLAFSLAEALHALGAAIVNPYPVSAALADKIVTWRTLHAAGVPTPETYVASRVESLRPLLDAGPIVVKPYKEGGGEGIRIVRTAAELAEVPRGREPIFAQRYHPPRGRDRKIYAIGGRLFGVKKVFPRHTEEEKQGEPFDLTPQLREIAARCGEAFGIDLYGVDIIESEDQPYVVDMFSIPGFKGVPNAPLLLAQYFRAAAERASRGHWVDADKWRPALAGPLDAGKWRSASPGPDVVGGGPAIESTAAALAARLE
jgi:ribosomal protein S6--L-glutamate ligase